MIDQPKESIVANVKDPIISYLNKAVVIAVKVLAVFMVVVIWLSLADVAVHLFMQVLAPPVGMFNVETVITTFGNFLVVLIAIEIYLNIIFYLKQDAIHVPLVIATALTAVARKVIIFDYSTVSALHVLGAASVIFALGLTYWLITKSK
jgi:uncharacterized membrane protein (DUF373 family)